MISAVTTDQSFVAGWSLQTIGPLSNKKKTLPKQSSRAERETCQPLCACGEGNVGGLSLRSPPAFVFEPLRVADKGPGRQLIIFRCSKETTRYDGADNHAASQRLAERSSGGPQNDCCFVCLFWSYLLVMSPFLSLVRALIHSGNAG